MKAVGSSETLVTFYQITRCHAAEGNKLHINCREIIKFRKEKTSAAGRKRIAVILPVARHYTD
jgi:hypothetical protein